MENKARYLDGLSAQHLSCTLVLKDSSLFIYPDDKEKGLIIWQLRDFKSCHLNGSSLIVTYGKYPHQTIECSGDFARKLYNEWSQGKIVKRAEGFIFRRTPNSVIIFCLAFLFICFISYFVLLPWLGKKSVALVPIDLEVSLGESLAQSLTAGNTIDDSATYYASRFTSKLNLGTVYPIDVKVITSPEINAFALPGGKIFIYSGILKKMDSYEQLVALIGHEVTHVSKRHALKSIMSSAASGIVISALFGDLSGVSSWILSQANEFKELDYSRALETEADNNGLAIMKTNGVNPEGMVNLLKLLKKESAEMPALMKYLSTHPDTDSRIEGASGAIGTGNNYLLNTELEIIFNKLQQQLQAD